MKSPSDWDISVAASSSQSEEPDGWVAASMPVQGDVRDDFTSLLTRLARAARAKTEVRAGDAMVCRREVEPRKACHGACSAAHE